MRKRKPSTEDLVSKEIITKSTLAGGLSSGTGVEACRFVLEASRGMQYLTAVSGVKLQTLRTRSSRQDTKIQRTKVEIYIKRTFTAYIHMYIYMKRVPTRSCRKKRAEVGTEKLY